MATGHGSMSFEQTLGVQKSLETSPSATAGSSPVYGGKGGKKMSKSEKPAKAGKMKKD